MVFSDDIKERSVGRWHGILPQLGLQSSFLSGRHGPCPLCGGKDRWRFDNKEGRGTWYCTRCGAGDGFKLAGLLLRKGNFRDIMGEVAKVMGGIEQKHWSRPDPREQEQRMATLWREAEPLKRGSPVLAYLQSRGIKTIPDDVRHREGVMYALCRDASGRAVQMHRTELTTKQRKYMSGLPLPAGCAVRLMAPRQGVLGIAEGIETALSAAQLYDIPCWAALDALHLGKWEPPEGIKRVAIFGDHDENYVGQSVVYALARRLAGRDNPPKIEVMIPNRAGYDWNDMLRAKG